MFVRPAWVLLMAIATGLAGIMPTQAQIPASNSGMIPAPPDLDSFEEAFADEDDEIEEAPAASEKLPSLAERVAAESAAMKALYAPIAKRHGVSQDVAMLLATQLGSREWAKAATRAGVPAKRHKALWQDLNALPHPNFDQLTPYNLMAPAKDRWGLSPKQAIRGWNQYGGLIEEVAITHGLDPVILGAYVWTESNFDTNQYTAARGLHAVGLGSVQAQYFPQLGATMPERVRKLQRDPKLNLTLTAREFKAKWNPQDMFGTVMDVWYPAWRRGQKIPNLGNAFGYMQLYSNRYFLLLELVGD